MLRFLLDLVRLFSHRFGRQDHNSDILSSAYTVAADLSKEKAKDTRSEILLTEYKEIIDTLRNWDRIIYQVLTIVGSVAAALISFAVQRGEPIAWGVILSLLFFWLFVYIWLIKLAEVRIDVLIEIEKELEMKGQYRRLREVKQTRTFIPWFFLPFLGAFVLGPALGFIISNPSKALGWLKLMWTFIISVLS